MVAENKGAFAGRRWLLICAIAASAFACSPRVTPARPAPSSVAGPTPIEKPQQAMGHLFSYTPAPGENPQAVNLAGDFNNWSTTDTPMVKQPDGSYAARADLADGIHAYKFVVDGKWIDDPNANPALSSDDGNGGKNSGVLIGIDATRLPPFPPGKLNASAVSFDPSAEKYCDIVDPSTVRLSITAQKGNVSQVLVWTQGHGQGGFTVLPRVISESGLDRFAGLIGNNVRYYFELRSGGKSAFIANGIAYPNRAAAEASGYSVYGTPTFKTPNWAKHAVWYQIFPERFRNGDKSNDPKHTVRWTSKWFSKQPGEKGKFYSYIYHRRYGGDLQGIIDELPYLKRLGVNALYLNPVFEAPSLHKYDTSDYRHVDEHFGTLGDIEKLKGETDNPASWQWTASDKLLLKLIAEAHKQGFHIILDGVFNHVGTQFWAFQDVIKNGKKSKYAGWFDITSWEPVVNSGGEKIPFHYLAWDGDNGMLPIFKKDPKLGIVHGPREHILAIAKRWLAPDGDPSRGIDGFRLDAPQNVPHPFWIAFRKTVKAIKPNGYIDGEIWSWAQPWLSGNQFDGVMNYQFAIPMQGFFVDEKNQLSPSTFARQLTRLELNYPFQVSLVNQNLLDSHDTDRAASMFMNPDLGFNAKARIQDNNPNYNPSVPTALDRARMLQELVAQMTFVGAPMIYYGDEAGQFGAADPSDRKPMVWPALGSFDDPNERFDYGKFKWYQRLIAIRNDTPALQTGFYHAIETNKDGVLAYERTLKNAHVYVVINRSAHAHKVVLNIAPGDDSETLHDWLNPAEATLNLHAGKRPTISPTTKTERVVNGKVRIDLGPWKSAVISR